MGKRCQLFVYDMMFYVVTNVIVIVCTYQYKLTKLQVGHLFHELIARYGLQRSVDCVVGYYCGSPTAVQA